MEGAVSRVGTIWECDGWRWSDDHGSDLGRIVAIWKASVRPSRGWSWVVGNPEVIQKRAFRKLARLVTKSRLVEHDFCL
jgi:hypothetical protein